MKLVKYLADYLLNENCNRKSFVRVHHSGDMIVWSTVRCEELIQQSIKAFESAEGIKVRIVNVDSGQDLTAEML